MTWLRRDSRDGVRFQTLLLGLFLIPMMLATVLLSVVTVSLADRVATADRAVKALDVETRIGAAQAALLAEVIPTLAPVFASRLPQLSSGPLSAVTSAGLSALGFGPARTVQLRATTDRALAAVDVAPARLAKVTSALAEVRRAGEQPETTLAQVLGQFNHVSDLLRAIEFDQQLILTRSGHSAQLAVDVQVAQIAAELAASADFERGLVLAATVIDDPALREQWAVAWGTSLSLRARLNASATGPVAAAWVAAQDRPPVVRSDRRSADFFASGLQSKPALSLPDLADILSGVGDLEGSSAAYLELLDVANGQVRAQVSAERTSAVRVLLLVLSAAVLSAVPLLLVTVVLVRSVTRPLARLAADAREISEGVLVDVGIGGPREVRSVGRALDAAVATLRRVQSQAEAFSTGDLRAAVLTQPVPGPLGAVLHESIEAALVSVQETDRLRHEMAHLAAHDGLTGLPNRGEVLNLLSSALDRARRAGSSVALLFLDLDHFKQVNDGFGHGAGDIVLLEVARRLRAEVRLGDTVGRLGGDEFVVVVEPLDEALLLGLAERLVVAVSSPINVADRSVVVGVSIGVSVSRDGLIEASALLSEGDAAAYRAKAAGRGRVDLFDDALREELRERADLERDMAAGLTRGEFVLHFQPVIDVATGQTAGVEALVRWQRPGHGLVPPMEFIPVAEQSTLVCDLGRWVLHESMRQLSLWLEQGRLMTMGINISGRHVAAARIVEDVRDALAASGVDPSLVHLELTETVFVGADQVRRHLEDLRAMGVKIALDDFGTGFTSIGQLQWLPVDVLKIDRSFVAVDDAPGRALLALMVRAAHALSLVVVAEGVEEPEQYAYLQELGCDSVQGFLFARPMPAADLADGVLTRP